LNRVKGNSTIEMSVKDSRPSDSTEEGRQIVWSDEQLPNPNRSIYRGSESASKFNREIDLQPRKRLSQRTRMFREIVTVAAIPENGINAVCAVSATSPHFHLQSKSDEFRIQRMHIHKSL
jgi:hypothetical protein